ncbi:hypothetical protein Micbo1qcDRAFT_210480 [Microdochium bolleyi]|uniref:Helicase C-terminal domain-containing protein n=1 Tax=Microdochium bolleyi TaxID=196109 RepID=A0A136IIP2_9PEZI|nr:hypothetical protein Micbo1qcDRAFT_210480 [Microdochium bolleyi]
MMLVGGIPGRRPDIATLRFVNTAISKRSLLLCGSHIAIYCFSSKTIWRGGERPVWRFLPARLSRLVVVYLCVVQPFAHVIESTIRGDTIKGQLLPPNPYLFSDSVIVGKLDNRTVYDQLTSSIKKLSNFRPTVQKMIQQAAALYDRVVAITGTLPPLKEHEFHKLAGWDREAVRVVRALSERANLAYNYINSASDQYQQVATTLVRELQGSDKAIIYTTSKGLYDTLSKDLSACKYHGGIEDAELDASLIKWQQDGSVIIATTKLGLGVDFKQLPLVGRLYGKVREFAEAQCHHSVVSEYLDGEAYDCGYRTAAPVAVAPAPVAPTQVKEEHNSDDDDDSDPVSRILGRASHRIEAFSKAASPIYSDALEEDGGTELLRRDEQTLTVSEWSGRTEYIEYLVDVGRFRRFIVEMADLCGALLLEAPGIINDIIAALSGLGKLRDEGFDGREGLYLAMKKLSQEGGVAY